MVGTFSFSTHATAGAAVRLRVGKEVPAKPPLCSWVGIGDFRVASPDVLHNSQQVTSPC